MTPTNDMSLEIQRRIQTANRCFCSRATFHARHKTLIREENQLLVFERNVLRTICGPKIENGVCRRRFNHELDKEFKNPNALNVTKTSRLRYAGHMIRRPEDLPQKALFKAKPIGMRNQGRPKSRWVDGVNSNSLALGVRVWTHCAQDRQLFY
jgi:hypothetical protein